MKHYRTKVHQAAQARDGTPLYNGSLNHAAVLAEEIFANAGKDINIFSGSLNARVYGTSDLIEKARQFLADSTHKVRVLIEHPSKIDAVDHPFVREFMENDDVEFHVLSENMQDSTEYHFMVMDEDSYRFEKNKSEPSAIAAFGDKTGGKRLTEIFNLLWATSKPYKFG